MNIFLHELQAKLKSVAIWVSSIAALIFVFMSLFEAFAEQSAMVSELMKSFPQELLIAFGMVDLDWSTVLGFYALIFVFVQVCLAIQAANYGVGLVSVEETEWTADFLLSKPVGRPHIMTSKLLAALVSLAITQGIVWGASFLFINMFRGTHELPADTLVILLLSMIVFQLFFLMVGMAISLLVKRVRSVLPISMGLVFGLYILNAFGSMIGEQSLEIISPFKQFAPGYIVKHGAWDWSLAWISVVLTVIAVAASYVLYSRRNISSAV